MRIKVLPVRLRWKNNAIRHCQQSSSNATIGSKTIVRISVSNWNHFDDIFLHLFRIRALTANLPTGLQNLDETVAPAPAAAAEAASSTTAAAATTTAEVNSPSTTSAVGASPSPPPTVVEVEEDGATAAAAAEAAVIETTALINENYVATGATRRPIVPSNRLLVPVSHNDWVVHILFLSFFISK
jgi:hypothetical protein